MPALKNVAEKWEPYALDVLSGILSAGRSARLPRILVREKQIAVDADAGYSMYTLHNNMFEVDATPASGHTGTVPILSGDLVRVVWVRLFAKLVGILLGILLANLFLVDLLAVLQDPLQPMRAFDPNRVWLTGVALGLGSGPVHKLITTIERQRDKRTAKKQQET